MFSRQKYGGVTKYFCEMIKNQPKESLSSVSVLCSNNQHLKDNFSFFKKIYFPFPPTESRLFGHFKKNLYKFNRLYSTYKISSNNFDLFHPTYYDTYFLEILKRPYVITVHDLIFFKYKELSNRENEIAQMCKVIKNSNRIIAISENTKHDLIDILDVDPGKIDVIYHGFNKIHSKKSINPYGRYLLYVGARPGYKNFKNLAKAFKIISIKDKDLKLVCVGSAFTEKELDELKELEILNRTIAIGVNEIQLNHLYANALAFVYPTEYEGFGMSILEAFSNDCPVCLSNTSCLPEIAGEGGSYFDPYNVDSIVNTVKEVIYNKELAEKMVKKGNKRLENFSWKRCSQETLQTYKKALS